jgi:hypothetical protein
MTDTLQVREPSPGFARNAVIPTFFGQPMLSGVYADPHTANDDPQTPAVFYSHPNGEIWMGDAIAWLRRLPAQSVDLVFADDVRIPYGNHTLKYPEHPQAETSQYGKGNGKDRLWHPHPKGAKPKDVIEIPTTCNGMHEKTAHPTQKPEELLRQIILASSNPGDLVIDPFLGSGTTAVVAEQLKRRWKGCDVSPEYCRWAAERIELVEDWPVEKWIEYDQQNTERRKSIR